MRLDLRQTETPGVSALFAGAGTALVIGISEWARAALHAEASATDLQRGLVLVCGVYAAIGLLAGAACWLARRVSPALCRASASVQCNSAVSQPRMISASSKAIADSGFPFSSQALASAIAASP